MCRCITFSSLLVTLCTNRFNIQKNVRSAHIIIYVFCDYVRKTATLPHITYSDFLIEKNVYCAVRVGSLIETVNALSLKG